MPQILVLLGPTAVGKTAVAMALQDRLGGPSAVRLISVDSAMVYRGMDIGTGKPTQAELAAHPHELVDIRDPTESYTAGDFVADADRLVRASWASNQLPVLVGGTMLYADRFCSGIAALPESDPALRRALQAELDERGNLALHEELTSLDADTAAGIHPNNSQRLLRALEVVRQSGVPMSTLWAAAGDNAAAARLGVAPRLLALVPDDRMTLHARIEARFDAMLAAGFVNEARALAATVAPDVDLPAHRAVGYRQAWPHVAGEMGLTEFRAAAIAATRQLAKRQLTWMRGWRDLEAMTWGDPEGLAAEIAQRL